MATKGLATAATSHPNSITVAIQTDHRELESYYKNIADATDDDTCERWQNQFVWELARHSIGEELVVYPAFEKYLPNGKEMADNDRKDHSEVKLHLKKFQNLNPSNPAFTPTLTELIDTLRAHIKDEETKDLPALEKALSSVQDASGKTEESASLARSFERTKLFVPTRSHPTAPDKPPLFESAVGLMAAPIDKLKDMFSKFPKEDTPGQRPNV